MVLVARGPADQVQPGGRVVETPVGPQRLDQLVLGLGRHDAPDEEDVGSALGAARGQLGRHPRVGTGGDAPVVGQDRHHLGTAAPGSVQRLLAEGALRQPEQRHRRQAGQLLGRPGRPGHAVGLPAREELRRGEIVEIEDQRQALLGQVAGHRRRGRELVDGDVARGGVLGVRPVLVRRAGQVVVNGFGEDLGTPPGPPQRVAQEERVGARGVVRVQRGDELVDGHRPPGGGAHRSNGEMTLERTATTR